MKKKELRIAIFHLAFLYSGGGERLVLEEALGLRKLGHTVDVFSPIIDRKNCFPELLKKVKIHPLIPKLPHWIPDVELISILLACLFAPFIFLKFKNYDVYLGANQPGPWIAYILSKINKKPYAVYLSQPTRLIHPRLIDQKTGLKIVDGITILNIVNFFFKPLINFIDSMSITNTPLVFADGTYMKGILEEVYQIPTVNLPAATHLQRKITSFTNRHSGTLTIGKYHISKPYVLVSNRHFPQKKFEYAIESLRIIGNPNLSLVICGKETSYTKYLKQHTNNNNVYFVGLVNEKNLTTLYKHACVYVYPSPEEDFGMGIIEAMSHSLPVVAWENGGPTGIITSGVDGFLAKPFSMKDFSEKIKILLTDKTSYRKIARNGYKTVREHFTFQAHNLLLSRYLISLVAPHRYTDS